MSSRDSGVVMLLRFGVCLVGLLLAFSASASDDLDVTMRMVMDGDALTDQVVREIELPTPDLEHSRTRDVMRGQDQSEEARQSGREFGQSVSEDARSARESLDQVRERPEKPEVVEEIKENGPPGLNR